MRFFFIVDTFRQNYQRYGLAKAVGFCLQKNYPAFLVPRAYNYLYVARGMANIIRRAFGRSFGYIVGSVRQKAAVKLK